MGRIKYKSTFNYLVKIFLICMVGVSINLLGAYIVKFTGLPIYLDSVGTIIISAICGYLPGIIVGLVSGMLKGLLINPMSVYFSLIKYN